MPSFCMMMYAYINLFFHISTFSLCRGYNIVMAELRPSKMRGLRQSVLSHFDVFSLQGLQFGYGRTW
ncbi:hypothetical protein L208DRAFT_1419272 [Tricholoma matsutake]|nr:hypothetical protein L208DRAFT_1419272 [Tricholoma matsutake 945]